MLVRDSPTTDPAGSFNSLLGDISLRVEIAHAAFKRRGTLQQGVPYYAQMLVGMTVFTGQYWADRPKVNKEQLAAYVVDLAWHGLSRLDSKPILRFESQKAKQLAARKTRRRDKERSETTVPDEPDAPVDDATTTHTAASAD